MKFFSTVIISCLVFIQINVCGQTSLMSVDMGFNTYDNNDIDVVHGLVKQNDKLVLIGSFRKIAGVSCKNICRLLNDSVVDPSFNSGTGFNYEVKKVVVLPVTNKLLVMGAFTTYSGVNINYMMRLNADGTPDLTFIPNFDAGSTLVDFAVQADGKVVVIGLFNTYSGYPRKNIVRLNSNGNLDLSFNSGDATNGKFNQVVIQSTGKIILVGEFDQHLSTSVTKIVRLLTNGDVDATFSCVLTNNFGSTVGIQNIFVHPNDEISLSRTDIYYTSNFFRYDSNGGLLYTYPFSINKKALLLENGNILTTSSFSNSFTYPREYSVNGTLIKDYVYRGWTAPYDWGNDTPILMFEVEGKIYLSCNYLENYTPKARKLVLLGPNNEIDPDFLPSGGPNFSVTSMAKYGQDKLVLLGGFSRIGKESVQSIAIVDSTCKVVSSFQSGVGFNGPALCMAVQQDGKIVVGGDFTSYNNQSANRLVRLLPDGSIDPTFSVGSGPDYPVYDIQLIGNDKILIAGVFSTYKGTNASNIFCLNLDGSANAAFNANLGNGTNGRVRKLHRNDTLIYVIGDFNYYNGNLRKHIFRIHLDGSFDATFDVGQGDNGLLNDAAVFDNKIYAVGNFTSFSSIATSSIARLNTDGSIDASYVYSDYLTLPGFNIEVIDSTLLYAGVNYSSNSGGSGMSSSSYQGFSLTKQNGYLAKQNLYSGSLSYLPETSIDSTNYYLKHLKIFVDGNNIYFYGSSVEESYLSSRGSFIVKYKYTPPIVVVDPTGGGGGGNPDPDPAPDPAPTPPNLYYTFSNNELILNDTSNSKGVLYLTDIDGSVVSADNYQTNTGIDIQSLNPGMYFIKYINENQTDVTIIKLIIN